MKKIMVLVDVQNDFITGALANSDADKKVNAIVEHLKTNKYDEIYATMDTHSEDYLDTDEGKRLPVPHCIGGTKGWNLDKRIVDLNLNIKIHTKSHFMARQPFIYELISKYADNADECEIVICGFCTDICVVSNALLIKRSFPNVTILENLCSGVTKEKHDAAIEVMRSCLIDIK